MNKKVLASAAVVVVLAAGLFAWNSAKKSESKALPMEINKEAREIVMPAEVNGKYFNEPTRHGVVFLTGSNGEKSVLRGLSDEKEFHAALISLGAVPGDNVKLADMKAGPNDGKSVEGTKLNVFVKWDGSNGEIPFNDIIKATNPRPMDVRFGGNLEAAKKANTGCILCLDSCAVGITSNSSYPTGTTQNKVSEFYGNKDVLPADGTRVSVIFRIAE